MQHAGVIFHCNKVIRRGHRILPAGQLAFPYLRWVEDIVHRLRLVNHILYGSLDALNGTTFPLSTVDPMTNINFCVYDLRVQVTSCHHLAHQKQFRL